MTIIAHGILVFLVVLSAVAGGYCDTNDARSPNGIETPILDLNLAPLASDADSVEETWVRHFTDPDSGNWVYDAEVDDDGNTYVTGWAWGVGLYEDYATVKYDAGGNLQWATYLSTPVDAYERAQDLTLGASGTVYVTGRANTMSLEDFGTVAYDPNGQELWAAYYDGTGLNDEALAVTVDEAGNVYVTGTIQVFDVPNAYIRTDIATIKYGPDGTELWNARYNSGVIRDDRPVGIAVDPDGNVYVAGYNVSVNNGPSGDFITIKYDASGSEIWVDIYDGPISGNDQAKAMALDGQGFLYVAGYVNDTPASSNSDLVVIKYTSAGARDWVSFYDRTGGWDEPDAMIVDDGGTVYLTGWSMPDMFTTVKMDPDGNVLWASFYDWFDGPSFATDLAVDSHGNVYVTGDGWMPGGNDMATVKYGADGTQIWEIAYEGIDDWVVWANSIGLDSQDNVYVTGTLSNATGPGAVFTVIRYTQLESSGTEPGDPINPGTLNLISCSPNPVRSEGAIRYLVPHTADVSLQAFSVTGSAVQTLISGTKPSGEYLLQWNPSGLPSGAYILRLEAGDSTQQTRVVLTR